MPEFSESQKFIHISKYSRWIDAEQRRESSWEETANRYLTFMKGRFGTTVPRKAWDNIEKHLLSLGVVPSMRAVSQAGPALEANNIMAYNCSYVPFQDLQAVVELFYILMCGAGVGFSVEKENIDQMPAVPKWDGDGMGVYVIEDSREGWAKSLRAGFDAWFSGKDIEFDYSKIRPRGARLRTTGGRASGPEPLKRLHDFCRETISKAQGRKLNSVEWLDIGNVIGDVVVVGGVRRASEVTYSDISDDLVRDAKDGNSPAYRSNSNNSAVYFEKPDPVTFLKEWTHLVESQKGERGILNLAGYKNICPERRKFTWSFRTNPCVEILLRPFSFCNLTEVVVRADDDFDDLIQKVEACVWMGAMQSTLTKFPFIRKEFEKNCKDERLLGVSLTGQMDNPELMTPEKLSILKKFAIKTAKKASSCLGIHMSTAITCGKPSGTVSQLVDAASGAHPRYAPYYIRRYRISSSDPVYKLLKDQGVKFKPENGQGPEDVAQKRKDLIAKGRTEKEAKILVPDWDENQVFTWVFSMPMAAPKDCITRNQLSAIEQLEWYQKILKNWCEHNQSITIFVRDSEWIEVGAWVYDHFNDIVGISFLPHSEASYKQMPYQECTKEEYEKMIKEFPKIDYSQLPKYEMDDGTTSAQLLACQGSSCEL